ncbi:MAG: hypothetical protein KDE28_07970 [Anaerolineales bacterium]|nr:hypothetical protein [Anaerolineales bacterium]
MSRNGIFFIFLALFFLATGIFLFGGETRSVDIVGLLACGAVAGTLLVRGARGLREE